MGMEKFVNSFDGTQIYVQVIGQGEPLVLVDGVGCDGFIWHHFIPFFREKYRLVHMHYRGHGFSAPPKDLARMRVGDYREDLRTVLDELSVEKPVLVGHSMGVQVILDFALTYPDRVAALIPVCGSYGRPLDTFHDTHLLSLALPYLHGLVERFPRRIQWLWTKANSSALAYYVASLSEVNGTLVSKEEMDGYFGHLASMDVKVFMAALRGVALHTVEPRLGEVKQPTLVVGGERDTFTPARLSHRMAEKIPGAELLMMPGGTHVAPLEIPELIHLRVDRFLSEHVAASLNTKQKNKGDASKKKASRKKPPTKTSSSAKPRRKKQASSA